MLDLKKLEAKLNQVLETETEESFNEWLKNKQQKEFLGNGEFYSLETKAIKFEKVVIREVVEFTNPVQAQITGNIQYSLAA